MNEQRFELVFNKELTKLAGNRFGRTTYSSQVKEDIILSNDKITIVIPSRIDRVATSFVQGFFDEIMMQVGLAGIKNKIFFETSIPNFKEFVIANLE